MLTDAELNYVYSKSNSSIENQNIFPKNPPLAKSVQILKEIWWILTDLIDRLLRTTSGIVHTAFPGSFYFSWHAVICKGSIKVGPSSYLNLIKQSKSVAIII